MHDRVTSSSSELSLSSAKRNPSAHESGETTIHEKSIHTSARKRCIHSKCINTQLNIDPLSPISMLMR